MSKLITCEKCENLNIEDVFGLKMAGCKLTGLVIPHNSDSKKDEMIFHRVPMQCPRPDSEVVKRESLCLGLAQ